MVKIRTFKDIPVQLLYLGELVGTIETTESFDDVRCQIAQEMSCRYSIIFKGQEIYINHNGRPESWPEGLFDEHDRILDRLISIEKAD